MKTISKCLNMMPLILLGAALTLGSCSKDDPDPDPDPISNPTPDGPLTFASVLARGGDFESFPESRDTDTLEVGENYNEEYTVDQNGSQVTQRFVCQTSKVSVLDGNGKFPLFNANAEVIYPASLLQGKTLRNATPSIIPVKRAGGTISYNLNNGNLNSAFEVEEVTKSSIQNAMNNIIANSPDVVPANFNLDIEEVFSESQLAIEMGIDVQTFRAKASADLSFSTDKSYNRFLVKLTQEYYTMSFDLPTRKEDIFHESVTPEDLSTYVQEDNPATFISSVTYGRIFYMLVESTSSRQEMSAKLDASYGAFRNKVEGSVEVDAFNSLDEVRIKVIAYGGDAKGTFELTGETNINAIANKLAESTDIRTGLPLSYIVRSVERPDIVVGTKLATEYDAVKCELRGALPPLGYRNLEGVFEDGYGAATAVAGSNAILFNGAGTEYIWFNGNTGNISPVYSIKDANAPLGVIRYDAIGAALLYIPGEIWLYDENSLEFVILKFNASPYAGNNNTIPSTFIGGQYSGPFNVNQVHNSNLLAGDSFPFASLGFDAAAYLGYEDRAYTENGFGTVTVHNVRTYKHIYIQKGQNNYYAYENYVVDRYQTTNIFGNVTDTGTIITRTWTNRADLLNVSNTTFPFDHVGAACKITLGNTTNAFKLLYFNDAGDEFFVRNGVLGSADGPYVLN